MLPPLCFVNKVLLRHIDVDLPIAVSIVEAPVPTNLKIVPSFYQKGLLVSGMALSIWSVAIFIDSFYY